jgi:DNA polymerase-3 subunit delta
VSDSLFKVSEGVRVPIKCLDFLVKRPKTTPAVIAIAGDEDFLKREAVKAVRDWILGADADDFTFTVHDGDEATASEVFDEAFTPPFLGDRRLIVVEGADGFVTQNRSRLESYVAKPSPCAVLTLVVSTWPSNTRLAKAVEERGLTIDAAGPKAWHVPAWSVRWAKERYAQTLEASAADWLVELVGPNLAGYLAAGKTIDSATVDALVAGTRTETAFKLFDMVLERQLGKALELLDRQFVAGESPVGILAMISSQLRRLAKAAKAMEQGESTADALRTAGIPPFALDKARAQLEHFGKPRLQSMYRRLLQADLDLKGSSGLRQETVVERLLVDLARPKTAAKR